MYRVEDKYICSERDMLLLQSRMKLVLNPDRFSRGDAYKITSLYFDDFYDSHLSDSVDGVSYRNKYRIRIYNGVTDVIKLEVKYKLYNRVFKLSKTISKDDARKLIFGQCITDNEESMNSAITLFNLAIKQDLLEPKVIVEYDRSAYTFSPGNVRITFDRNIRYSRDFEGFLDNQCTYGMLKNINRIIEVKYDEFLPGFIGQVLESGDMQQIAFSKYKLCREQMEEETYVD